MAHDAARLIAVSGRCNCTHLGMRTVTTAARRCRLQRDYSTTTALQQGTKSPENRHSLAEKQHYRSN